MLPLCCNEVVFLAAVCSKGLVGGGAANWKINEDTAEKPSCSYCTPVAQRLGQANRFNPTQRLPGYTQLQPHSWRPRTMIDQDYAELLGRSPPSGEVLEWTFPARSLANAFVALLVGTPALCLTLYMTGLAGDADYHSDGADLRVSSCLRLQHKIRKLGKLPVQLLSDATTFSLGGLVWFSCKDTPGLFQAACTQSVARFAS